MCGYDNLRSFESQTPDPFNNASLAGIRLERFPAYIEQFRLKKTPGAVSVRAKSRLHSSTDGLVAGCRPVFSYPLTAGLKSAIKRRDQVIEQTEVFNGPPGS